MTVAIPEARTRALVVGKPGTGKSTYVKRRLEAWQRRGVRIVAIDPHDEYSRHGNDAALVQLGGLKKRVTPAELAKDPSILLERRLSLAVVVGEHPRDAARGFILVARLLRAAKKHVLVVADEVGLWCDKSAHPACSDAEAELKALATGGRKYGVSMWLAAQRAAQVPLAVRSTVTEIHAFYQDERADLEALALRTGNADFAARVGKLPPFQCLTWDDASNRVAQSADATPALEPERSAEKEADAS